MHRRGFSLSKAMAVIAVPFTALFIAVQSIHRAQTNSETGVMKTITTLHTAETQYFAQFEKFAGSLAELGPPANGSANRAAADLIPARLATTAEGSGYAFAIALTATGYTIHANPISFGATGKRTFFSDQSLTIHYHDGPEPATASGPAIK